MTADVQVYTYDESVNLLPVISNGDTAHPTIAGVNRVTNRIDDRAACTRGATASSPHSTTLAIKSPVRLARSINTIR